MLAAAKTAILALVVASAAGMPLAPAQAAPQNNFNITAVECTECAPDSTGFGAFACGICRISETLQVPSRCAKCEEQKRKCPLDTGCYDCHDCQSTK